MLQTLFYIMCRYHIVVFILAFKPAALIMFSLKFVETGVITTQSSNLITCAFHEYNYDW